MIATLAGDFDVDGVGGVPIASNAAVLERKRETEVLRMSTVINNLRVGKSVGGERWGRALGESVLMEASSRGNCEGCESCGVKRKEEKEGSPQGSGLGVRWLGLAFAWLRTLFLGEMRVMDL
jgi:hypothetical protein